MTITIGNLTAGSSSAHCPPAGSKAAMRVRNTSGFAVAVDTLHADFDVGNVSIKGVIYADNAGSPGALLAVSTAITMQVDGVNALVFPAPVTVASGAYVWIGVISASGSISFRVTYGGAILYNLDDYASPATMFGSASIVAYSYQMYVSCTEVAQASHPVNDRDKLLQTTIPRYAPATDRAILLGSSSNQFNVSGAGVAAPASITLTPTLLNMTGIVSYSTSDDSPLTTAGNVGTLAYAAMLTSACTVTATIVFDGVTYTASQRITKIFAASEGAWTRAAFSKTALAGLGAGTISTAGAASFPPDDAWGAGTHWSGSQVTIAAGEVQYQADGIYSPITDATTWSAPYRSTLKVGTLAALTADLGSITAGDLRSVTIHGGAGYPTSGYAWPATAGSGSGFHLSESGLLIGNYQAGKYFKVDAAGDVYSPQFSIVNGVAKYSGALTAASGTFSGNMTADAISAVSTINIGPDQVTIPLGVNAVARTVHLTQAGTDVKTTEVALIVIASTGAPVIVSFCSVVIYNGGSGDYYDGLYYGNPGYIIPVCLYRDGTRLIINQAGVYKDQPGVGNHTYKLVVETSNGSNDYDVQIVSATLVLLEAKR